ncbi:Flp family type IVb pilin [Vampirovibrio chlorellavorus]|uniref:Flp family type IVb pilin n=1 Tax=Vampirovibrio chlorellavorus TaxID=758823 RepID=UPI0026EE865A|nr:hypothetical protein [Vampirovibrio chlorellavorus]
MGSTATEMGLIGAVVLVASLTFLFFLGEALQYAFSFVRKDMVTQVATANGLSPDAFVAQWKGGQPGQSEGILNPVQPTAPVVTAGSNGNEAHAEIYKALQELIDRSLKKGTMTEAQADLLSKYIKAAQHYFESLSAWDKAYSVYFFPFYFEGSIETEGFTAIYEAESAYEEVYQKTGSYEEAEAAYRNVLDDYSAVFDESPESLSKKYTTLQEALQRTHETLIIFSGLEAAAVENGLLDDPEVVYFIDTLWFESYEKIDLWGADTTEG